MITIYLCTQSSRALKSHVKFEADRVEGEFFSGPNYFEVEKDGDRQIFLPAIRHGKLIQAISGFSPDKIIIRRVPSKDLIAMCNLYAKEVFIQ